LGEKYEKGRRKVGKVGEKKTENVIEKGRKEKKKEEGGKKKEEGGRIREKGKWKSKINAK
jgi:hypothetical protein